MRPENSVRRGGNRGNQGQGERNLTGKAEKPQKGVKPIRDKDGKVIGWRTKDSTGRGVDKTLEWGRQNGLDPADFSVGQPVPGSEGLSTGTKIGIGIVVGGLAIACALAEPCGVAAAAAMTTGGAAAMAN